MKIKIAACLALSLGVLVAAPKSASAIPVACAKDIKIKYQGSLHAIRIVRGYLAESGMSSVRLRFLPKIIHKGDSTTVRMNLFGVPCPAGTEKSPSNAKFTLRYAKCWQHKTWLGRKVTLCNPFDRDTTTVPVTVENGKLTAVIR